MTAGWLSLLRCLLLPSTAHNWNCGTRYIETAVTGDGGEGVPEGSDGV